VNVPGLGEVTKDQRFEWHYSEPLTLSIFNGMDCRVVLEGYDDDSEKEDFHLAIANLLSAPPSALKAAERFIYQYYLDIFNYYGELEDAFPRIETAASIWSHVQLGDEPIVSRRHDGDRGIYVSLECNCDWEPEHGLQIVFRNGNEISKVGPYDGHLTNSDAFDDATLEGVVYRPIA